MTNSKFAGFHGCGQSYCPVTVPSLTGLKFGPVSSANKTCWDESRIQHNSSRMLTTRVFRCCLGRLWIWNLSTSFMLVHCYKLYPGHKSLNLYNNQEPLETVVSWWISYFGIPCDGLREFGDGINHLCNSPIQGGCVAGVINTTTHHAYNPTSMGLPIMFYGGPLLISPPWPP